MLISARSSFAVRDLECQTTARADVVHFIEATFCLLSAQSVVADPTVVAIVRFVVFGRCDLVRSDEHPVLAVILMNGKSCRMELYALMHR